MAFRSLLLSKDTELVQTLARLLKDLDIAVEPCSEPFAAAKRLMDQHFDAILVDCEDEQGAGWVLQSARMATASKKSITIAIVGAQSANRGGPRAGENFVIQKPIVLTQVEGTLRAARGLMSDGGTDSSSGTNSAPSSLPAPKPVVPAAAPSPHESTPGQGRPTPEYFDELTAVVDRLGPQAKPAVVDRLGPRVNPSVVDRLGPQAKPAVVASTLSGTAAATAPAREKPAITVPPAVAPPMTMPAAAAPEPTPRQDSTLAPRPAQSWPGLSAHPSAPPKPDAPGLLPLAASSAEMKPAARPVQDLGSSSNAFDDRRRRMESSAPPTWRTGVEERHEPPVPRFSGLAEEEEPTRGFQFKKIAVFLVLVSLALFGYSWYRGRTTSSTLPGNSTSGPAIESQAPAQVPSSAAPAPVAPSGNQANSTPADNFGGETMPAEPSTPKEKPSQAEPPAKAAAEVVAADTTTDLGTPDTSLPPAPLVVEGGKRHTTPAAHAAEPVAPPSLNTIAEAGKPALGGVVSATPVDLPKLAPAAPQRIRVSQGVTQGLLVRQVQPQYPAMARENRVEGDVVLEAVIGEDGRVRDLKVLSGPALLIPPTLRAVKQWQYKPYLLNGQPVEVVTQIKLRFRL